MKNTKKFPVKDEQFKTSSHTGRNVKGNGVEDADKWYCVEVAITPQGVAVRDTKNRDEGILFFNHNEWDAFIKGVKGGEFDLR
jgi:hypothetical protein